MSAKVRPLRPGPLALVLSAVALALGGCAAAADSDSIESEVRVDAKGKLVDANDVAILFPLVKNSTEVYPSLGLGEGDYLSESAFDSVISFAQKKGFDQNDANITFRHTVSAGTRASWRVVAARIDLCAQPLIPPPAPMCQVQLRLVAQPFGNNASGGQDAAFHLIYVLGTEKPVPGYPIPAYPQASYERLAADLLAVQAASERAGGKTAGVPLGVHPGLAAEASRGGNAVANAVRALIENRIAESKARAITMMGLRDNSKNAPDFWVFFGGLLRPDSAGRLTLAPVRIPTFTRSEVLVEGFNVLTNNFSPISGPEQPVHAGNLFTTNGFVTSTKEAHQIDNPHLFDVLTQDCVSCHTATRQNMIHRARVAEDFTYRYVPPAGVTAYVQCKNLPGTGMNGCVKEALNPATDRKSTRLNSSHSTLSRMPSSA